MNFYEVLDQVVALLRQRGRVTYRALKLQFQLDDEHLETLKEELIEAQRIASDEDGKVLVWVSQDSLASSVQSLESEGHRPQMQSPPTLDSRLRDSRLDAAERRQLTVMFIDLVGSTTLSQQLDPEDYHARVVAYQTACHQVIARYEGHIAQYLGDGVLGYFGYPTAHEDDAQRAVRAGLEIIEQVQALSFPGRVMGAPSPALAGEGWGEGRLQVRIGVHTGLVVIGEIGSADKHEVLALGETPNVAARLQSLAAPDTLVLSAVTQRLVAGLFECQELGPQTVKGITTPLSLYRVVRESEAQSRFEVAVSAGLTPLVGRDLEVGLLHERWIQAKGGEGQVVLLSGEPGIGKSRLVQTLKEQVMAEGATRIEFRCSPYHQNSAFYPIIEHLQRLLRFHREESPQARLEKLQHTLSHYRFPQADTVSLLATLLLLPQPASAPPLTLSPQKQKEKTQEALVAWIIEEAEKTAVYCAWEDLHWADPSTLEVLALFLDQVPTARLLVLLTFRPEFTSPWGNRSHLSQMTLSRLGRSQVEALVKHLAGGKALPTEVLQQIVSKTDGVPLFVEELTKVVLESNLLRSVNGHYELSGPLPSLAIPATLQDSLMARLDRLSEVREVVQLGAVLGREFAHEMLRRLTTIDDATLQARLAQLVGAELLYQRGRPPRARYIFKHALIQDTAYASMLKSTRQRAHQQIAQVFVQHFPELVETQPEVVAHHYTEAGLTEQAIPYWQKAGQRAVERSAHVEAISHFTKGLELINTLPDTSERTQHELGLQTTLGSALIATKGYGAPDVEQAYTRARELCQQVGETPRLLQVLLGLEAYYFIRAELQTARKLAEQCLSLTQSLHTPTRLLNVRYALGHNLFHSREFAPALANLEQGIALYDSQQHRSRHSLQDLGVACRSYATWTLWHLGYPDQALKRSHDVLTLARELSHPFSLALALEFAAELHRFRREGQVAQERAEATIALSIEQAFPYWLAWGTILRGWALAEQGQGEEGIAQIRQGLAAYQATGAKLGWTWFCALLAEAHGKVGQTEEGLTVLAEALATVHKTGERFYEAEVYRLAGELSLRMGERETGRTGEEEKSAHSPIHPFAHSSPEECFWRAIEIARKQQAKSLELRAAMSLARLWQSQGKVEEARQLLAEIYNWFTEGFDTKDLQEAKALLEELA